MRTKDRPLFLGRAAKSVAEQTMEDFLLVVVNDGGKPDSIEQLLKKHHKLAGKVKVIQNPKSVGMEAASNLGIKNSESKYIAMLDDDDTWHKDFLKETTEFLEKNTVFKGVITIAEMVDEELKNNEIHTLGKKKFTPPTNTITLFAMSGNNQFTNNSFVYARDALGSTGLYDELLPVLGDWDFNLRFMKKYDIGFINKSLAYYHRRVGGKKSNSNTPEDLHLSYTAMLLNRSLRTESASVNELGIVGNLANTLWKIIVDQNRLEAQINELHVAAQENGARVGVMVEEIGQIREKIIGINKKIDSSFKQRATRIAKNFLNGRS